MIRQDTNVIETDFLIIGGSTAGTMAAIKAKEYGVQDVTLVEKGMLGKTGCSAFGAGVMTIRFPEDDPEAYRWEIAAPNGEWMSDQEWIDILAEEGYARLLDTHSWGAAFEKEGKNFARAFGRGHRLVLRNVMFHGHQFMASMRKQVLKSGVRVVERTMVTDLLTQEGKVVGAAGFDTRSGEFRVFKGRKTLLAAGANGFKSIFIGHKTVTGDAQAMGYRAGVEQMNLELACHNTTAKEFDICGLNMYVGYGAKLLNGQGEEFMKKYDPVYEVKAPLGRLAAAMSLEVRAGRGPIFLDTTPFTPEILDRMRRVIPISYHVWEKAGYPLGKSKVEWIHWGAPATIANGGGAKINTKCESNLPNLYIAGDSACALPHGCNDVGGLNFPYAMVSGERAARFAAEALGGVAEQPKLDDGQIQTVKDSIYGPLDRKEGVNPEEVLLAFQKVIMPADVSVIKREDRLKAALQSVERINREDVPRLYAADYHELRNVHELRNMVLCAEMFFRASLARKESRGPHMRDDYPELDNVDWLKWVVVYRENGEMKVRTEPIPFERYPLKPARRKVLHPIFAVAQGIEPDWTVIENTIEHQREWESRISRNSEAR